MGADYEPSVGKIMISVEDTGVCMTSVQVDRLFKNFTKFTANRSMNREGVGLGLSISKNIARALGGEIKVLSQIGIGSTFTLFLPFSVSSRKSDAQIILSRPSLN